MKHPPGSMADEIKHLKRDKAAMLEALRETRRMLHTLTTEEFQRGGDGRIRDLLDNVIRQATD